MSTATDYDVLILGAGCAGLSLARDVCRLHSGNSGFPRIALLEPRVSYANDRSWCFWQPVSRVDHSLVQQSWHSWRFSDLTHSIKQQASGWAYHYIPADRFYTQALAEIEKQQGIDLIQGHRAETVIPKTKYLQVETDMGVINCRWLIDSRPPPMKLLQDSLLQQVFYGVELQLDQHCLDSTTIDLMTGMQCDNQGFLFHYALPLSQDRLLLEVTRFSPVSIPSSLLRADLQHAIQDRLGDVGYQVLREEQGVIPMGLPKQAATPDPRWIRAGTNGGAVRASTGYAFQRIQQWADTCARSLLKNDKPVGQAGPGKIIKWMDRLFLTTLRNSPALAPDLFMSLADHVPPSSLVRFLTEQPQPHDIANMIRGLPPQPLIKTWLSEARSQPYSSVGG